MKKTLVILVVALTTQVDASMFERILSLPSQPARIPLTYLVKQNFETPTTGYDNGETWLVSSGTPNPVYTPGIKGTQSFDPADGRARFDWSAGNKDEVYGYFRLKLNGPAPGGNRDMVNLSANGSTTAQFLIKMDSSRRLVMGSTTTLALATNVDYTVIFHYKKGTGSDSVQELSVSTNGVSAISGSYIISITDGTSTGQAGRVLLGFTQSNSALPIFDDVRISEEFINFDTP